MGKVDKKKSKEATEYSVLSMKEKFFDPEREMKQRLQSRGAINSKYTPPITRSG